MSADRSDFKARSFVFLSTLASAFVVNSCAPVSTADLTVPDASITAVTMQMPQIETSTKPDVRLFVSIQDQAETYLSDFRLGNFSILEEGTPGVPLRWEGSPIRWRQ